MNEISKLIEAYNRLWKNIDMMRRDIMNILENDFGMEKFEEDYFDQHVAYNIYFKDKMVLYIIIDISVEMPFLQALQLNFLKLKDSLTKKYLQDNGFKGKIYNPNEEFEENEKSKKINESFTSCNGDNGYDAIISPKIDILSIDSTDTVNDEIKKLLSCIIKKDYEGFLPEKLKIIE